MPLSLERMILAKLEHPWPMVCHCNIIIILLVDSSVNKEPAEIKYDTLLCVISNKTINWPNYCKKSLKMLNCVKDKMLAMN